MKSNKYGDRIPLDISVRQNTYFCFLGKNQLTSITSTLLELNSHRHSCHIMSANFAHYSENSIAMSFHLHAKWGYAIIEVQSQVQSKGVPICRHEESKQTV